MPTRDATKIAVCGCEAAQIAALAQVAKVLIMEVQSQKSINAKPLLDLGWRVIKSHCAVHGICEDDVLRAMRRIEESGGLGTSAH